MPKSKPVVRTRTAGDKDDESAFIAFLIASCGSLILLVALAIAYAA